MTLNTFHLAGHGGANVTLGIPRLAAGGLPGKEGLNRCGHAKGIQHASDQGECHEHGACRTQLTDKGRAEPSGCIIL